MGNRGIITHIGFTLCRLVSSYRTSTCFLVVIFVLIFTDISSGKAESKPPSSLTKARRGLNAVEALGLNVVNLGEFQRKRTLRVTRHISPMRAKPKSEVRPDPRPALHDT